MYLADFFFLSKRKDDSLRINVGKFIFSHKKNVIFRLCEVKILRQNGSNELEGAITTRNMHI